MKQSTLVRHDIRASAGITLSQYVVLSFLDDLKEASLPLNEVICQNSIHVSLSDVMTVIGTLLQKELVMESRNVQGFVTTQKWKSFFQVDADFVTTFLQPLEIAEKKIAWGTSNRKEVEMRVKNMPKKTSQAELLNGKIQYFCYLRFLDWDRRAMAAEVFIGPKEHWKTDWWNSSPEFVSFYQTISRQLNKEYPFVLNVQKHQQPSQEEAKAWQPSDAVPVDPKTKLFR